MMSHSKLSPSNGKMLSPLSLPINILSISMINLLAKNHTQNVVISPLSISTAMSMVMLGARNETETQLFNGLLFNKSFDSSSLVHDQFKSLLNHPKFTDSSNEDLQLKIANFLLIKKDDSSQVAEYKRQVEAKYQAKSETVDFEVDGPKIQETVNAWVSSKINDKIPSMMDQPPKPDTFALLLNAVYFKGKWADTFERMATQDGTFYNEGTQQVNASLMRKSWERFEAAVNVSVGGQQVKIISIPYKNDLDMIVILPDDNEGLKKMADINYEELETGLKNMSTMLVNLVFPKFRIETDEELKCPLSSIGIKDVFTTNADLSGINGKKDLVVSSVVHKTFIEVNEEGTEAAGATMVKMVPMSGFFGEPTNFTVDHPFLFFIRDKTTGVFVFSGAINKL